MAGQFQFVQMALYELKKIYGVEGDFYDVVAVDQDPATGEKTVTKKKYTIRKIIRPGSTLRRQLAAEMGFRPTANQPTPPGFDVNETSLIVDAKDLPKGLVVESRDYFIINKERFNIKKIWKLEHNKAYLFTVTSVQAGEIEEIHTPRPTKHILRFTQVAEATL